MPEPARLFQDGAMLANRVGQPKSAQHAHGVRPHKDGRSYVKEMRRSLKDLRFESELPHRQRRRQATNAAANNCDLHRLLWHAHLARVHGRDTRPTPRRTTSRLLFVQLSSRVQIVKIHDHVPHERITSRSLSAPERIIREQNDVTAIQR